MRAVGGSESIPNVRAAWTVRFRPRSPRTVIRSCTSAKFSFGSEGLRIFAIGPRLAILSRMGGSTRDNVASIVVSPL